MYVKNVVIFDSQKQYSENLFQVLTKSKSPEVQFYLFHSMQDAEQFAKEKKIYALLTGEECPKEKRRQIPAVRKFVLVQDKRSALEDGEIGVYRYQSAEAIRAQMLERRVKRKETQRSTRARRGGQLIGVYSPIHRIGQDKICSCTGKEISGARTGIVFESGRICGFVLLFYRFNRADTGRFDLLSASGKGKSRDADQYDGRSA